MVAVRAMAPVAGRPPNIGETMLAIPWPMSSTLGLWRSLLMRSETTADISDSIAPSIATVNAGPSSPCTRPACNCGKRKVRQPAGNAAKARADGFDRQLEQERGQRGSQHGHNRARECGWKSRGRPAITATVLAASSVACRDQVGPAAARAFIRSQNSLGNFVEMQSEEIFDLGAGDQNGDAVGEADDDRPRNELHRRAHAGRAQDDEHHARHHRAHEQAVDAVYGDDAGDHHDERAGRPADLRLRSAQRRDQEAGDDGAVDAGLRRQPGRDRERHRQRQGHQADGDAGDQVAQKFAEAIVAQAQDGLGQPPVVQL